jgi:hypothetical protein
MVVHMNKNEHYYDHYWKPVLPKSYQKEEKDEETD